MEIKDRIQLLIKELNINKKEFADSIERSTGNISNWLNGRSLPSNTSLKKICKTFNVSYDWLTAEKGDIFINTIGSYSPTENSMSQNTSANNCETTTAFVTILKDLLTSTNTTQATLAKAIGVKANTVSDWLNKGNSPKLEQIYRISDFFNISFDYIFTGVQSKSIVNAKDIIKDKLAIDERSLLNTYRKLDDDGKILVLDYQTTILAEHPQPKSKLSNSSYDELIG